MSVRAHENIDHLPGADLVRQGIEDLERGRDTVAAALTRMAAPRLRSVGLDIPPTGDGSPAGHRLYELLAASDEATAHSRYNALVARMVSFARAAERARVEIEPELFRYPAIDPAAFRAKVARAFAEGP